MRATLSRLHKLTSLGRGRCFLWGCIIGTQLVAKGEVLASNETSQTTKTPTTAELSAEKAVGVSLKKVALWNNNMPTFGSKKPTKAHGRVTVQVHNQTEQPIKVRIEQVLWKQEGKKRAVEPGVEVHPWQVVDGGMEHGVEYVFHPLVAWPPGVVEGFKVHVVVDRDGALEKRLLEQSRVPVQTTF